MNRLRKHLSYANVMATIAVFFAVGGGAAYATHLVVRSSDIVNNEVRSADVRNDGLRGGGLTAPDLRAGSVGTSEAQDDSLTGADVSGLGGGDISDNSLTGNDIQESSLGTVPSATTAALGGTARYVSNGSCDPESATHVACGSTSSLGADAPHKVLVVARIRAFTEGTNNSGFGRCHLVGSQTGAIVGSSVPLKSNTDYDGDEQASLVGLTGSLPANSAQTYGIVCNNESAGSNGEIAYDEAEIAALAVSPN